MTILVGCFLDNYNFDGGDIGKAEKQIKTRDAITCQIHCIGNAECNYWTFDKASRKCYLKRELSYAKYDVRYQSGPKKCLVQAETEKEVDFPCMENIGVDLEGTEHDIYQISNVNSKESCKLACQKNAACKVFTYHKRVRSLNYQRCYVYKSTCSTEMLLEKII